MGIARALYRDADVIVMDEATSALDTMTERNVMDAIASLHGDKTLFIIAHRMSTLSECDRILVLDKGRVAGLGTWDEMARENKIFRAMLNMDAADRI
ncbi:lipid A export ATP-binding/permease protein MsbA [Roseobacter sp. GAI101]|nr:lipid A export ATP-binding/permease protein MsbA [Roseobacter sp. GAI101]